MSTFVAKILVIRLSAKHIIKNAENIYLDAKHSDFFSD